MAIDFPDSPTLNQNFTAGQRTWTWNGRAWQATSVTVGYTGSQGAIGYTGSLSPSTSTSTVGQVLVSNGPSNPAVWSTGLGNRNRIINGAMSVDQKSNGSSGTAIGYTIDRWQYNASQASKITWQQNGGAVAGPSGFSYYLGLTSSSGYTILTNDYFYITQKIEGLNVHDLQWGTANAKTITVSFYVRSNLTGTFTGSIQNSAQSRSYVFTYNISVAATWEYKTITIPGDTSGAGTWLTTNGIGLWLNFSLGVGSGLNGTTSAWNAGNFHSTTGVNNIVTSTNNYLYLTGVQLEVSSYASTFDYRSYALEQLLCYRYYQLLTNPKLVGVANTATAISRFGCPLLLPMRTTPTAYVLVGTINIYNGSVTGTITAIGTPYYSTTSLEFDATAATGTFTATNAIVSYLSGTFTISVYAEL